MLPMLFRKQYMKQQIKSFLCQGQSLAFTIGIEICLAQKKISSWSNDVFLRESFVKIS